MAYAIFKTGGKQYRVTEGDQVEVEKLDAKVGDTVTFDEVLLKHDGEQTTVGSPVIEGAKVTAKVEEQFRAPKVIAFKFKRRKGHHKTKGHRQNLTRLSIKSVI